MTTYSPLPPEILAQMWALIKDAPQVTVLDLMAEFDLTDREVYQALETLRALMTPETLAWDDSDTETHVAETVDELARGE